MVEREEEGPHGMPRHQEQARQARGRPLVLVKVVGPALPCGGRCVGGVQRVVRSVESKADLPQLQRGFTIGRSACERGAPAPPHLQTGP